MTSLILRTATRVLMPLLLLYGLFLLLRGHNAPGGGFAGGLVVAAAYALHSFAFGVTAARRALLVDPSRLIGMGLCSRSEAVCFRYCVTNRFLDVAVAEYRHGYRHSDACSMLGVFLVVIGVVTDDDLYVG